MITKDSNSTYIGSKINTQKLITFLCISNEKLGKNFKHCCLAFKKKRYAKEKSDKSCITLVQLKLQNWEIKDLNKRKGIVVQRLEDSIFLKH